MVIDERLDRLEDALAQSRLVRAAGGRGNQVGVRLAVALVVVDEGECPARPFTGVEAVGIRLAHILLAVKHRCHRVALADQLGEIALHPLGVVPGLLLGLFCSFDIERDLHARQ
ncbi:hypothetical protein D3C83_00440 [compost metagenome]